MKNLIGIFRGKQAEYNKAILNILWNNGPLSAWKITPKIPTFRRSKLHSLYATINKRLRSLEKLGYLKRDEGKWSFQFKGIIAGLLIQKNPKPWNDKWNELFNEFIKLFDKSFYDATIEYNGIKVNTAEFMKSLKTPKPQDWVHLSANVNNLIQKGVINFDVISNHTLLTLLLAEASNEEFKNILNGLQHKEPPTTTKE